jgi:hypothetical protein
MQGIRLIWCVPLCDSSTSDVPKTSFKTKEENPDDEAFAALVEVFKKATTELTGKTPAVAERNQWREFADLIVTELRIAAARTTVSNVPAFLTEHLRRRLWKKSREEIERGAKDKPPMQASGQGIDAGKCLDCGGTGWYYPEGLERGVAKCKHEKLRSGEGSPVQG